LLEENEMLIGKIVGSVVSTRKNEKLVGSKFMIVETYGGTGDTKRVVAVDNVGAGIGEMVFVATGSAARIGCDQANAPIDAAIVGIIDSGSGLPELDR
jgi:ethanolamine utilization protein EutN